MIKKNKKIITGIEIGTAKVLVLIGEISPDNTINIIGIGNHLSHGMNKGGVNNLQSIIKCTKKAINQAELMANYKISSIYLALSGKHINCKNGTGTVYITKEEVTNKDIENVIQSAKSVYIGNEYRILHTIPQEYIIDYQEGIKNPIGLSGLHMQVKAHLITCHIDMTKNIIKVIKQCGLKIKKIIFSGLASSYAVLTKDERKLGTCVVDIGAGTIDIVIYIADTLRYIKVIPYAGNTVTNDIACAFSSPTTEAEIIKIRYGCAIESLINKKNIKTPEINGKPSKNYQQQILAKVIESRYTELLYLINNEILQLQDNIRNTGGIHHLSGGIIFTGGGSQIPGLIERAQQIFNSPVRIGYPIYITSPTEIMKKPHYSTAIGLLQYGKDSQNKKKKKTKKQISLFTLIKKFNYWLKNFKYL
ncbi:Cell division protein ftsA [Candidatus Westeberhardia cardiocondylae]|uniref:Cell division protein FtsA n=1 Tax=Candidatus Westeberhardia cardiocondylae TaxID=1594731 RepID=A0A0H5BWZ9_9ENTR|nr:cell division protein FtsA [Candidatus Westeberhardia cardiocondylae]CEN32109.1 Cell division protein ftsA [Candidatus Westeberhardia cardiocondylae]